MRRKHLLNFKTLLLSMLCIGFGLQWARAQVVTITATGVAGSYVTGSVNSSGTKNDGAMININNTTNRGWAVFDLSTVPSGAIINSVTLYFTTYTSLSSTATNNVYGYAYTAANDPATVSGTDLYNSFTGTSLNASFWSANALQTKTLNATGQTLVANNIGGKIIIGFVRGSSNIYNIYGYDAANATDAPKLEINYTPTPACAGSPDPTTIAGPTAICPGAAFSLTTTVQTTPNGINYQWQSSPAGANTFTDISGATLATYNVTSGITASTDYKVKVTCSNTSQQITSSIYPVTVNPFYNCYCTPASSCVNEGIENVTMGTLNNSSTFCTNSTGYSDFSSLGSQTTVAQGDAAAISVTAHINSNPASAAVWIDYNHNGVFDASEFQLIGTASVTIPSGGTTNIFTGTINIDQAAMTGITRMRVRSANQSGITATSACTNSGVYGEYEDYLITIVAGTPCSGTPNGGTATASLSSVACSSTPFTVNATGYQSGVTGLNYIWQGDDGSGFADIGTATANYAPLAVTGISQTTSYRLKITCGATPGYSVASTVNYSAPPLPWTEGFESLTSLGSTNFPSCWVKENGDWASSNATSYNTAYSGSNYIRDSWSATNEYIWTPMFQLTAGTSYDLSFWVQGDGYTGWNVDVFTNTTQSSTGATQLGSTFTAPGTGSISIQSYTQQIYNFTPTTTGQYSFGIRVNQSSSTPWYIAFDDFSLDLTPSCSAPTALTLTSTTSNNATISWTASISNPADGYDYYYSTTNTPPTGTSTPNGSVGAGITTATLSPLAPNTTYYTWVRAKCSGTSNSAWSSSLTFTTQCNPTGLPYTEGFNTTAYNETPSCWTQQGVVGSNSLTYETTISNPTATPYEGTRSVFWNAYSIQTGATRLVSAPLTTTGTPSVDVNFYWLNDNTNYTDPTYGYYEEGVQVQYSLDGTTWVDAGSFIPRPDTNLASGATQWNLKTVTLPAAAGNQALVFVGFKFVSQWGNNCAMDAVSIAATPACQVPVMTATTAITANSASINWNASGTASPAGYEWEVRTSGLPGSGATGLAQNGSTTNPTVTASVSGLNAATTYTAYVRTDCGSGSYSAWSLGSVFTTACNTYALPYSQGFNTTATNENPACWTQQQVVGSSNLTYETSISNPTATPYEGTRSVFWNAYNILTGSTRLVSAPLTTTGTSSVDVNFYWLNDNTNYTDPTLGYYEEGVQVQYSLDGTTWVDAGSFIPRPDTTLGSAITQWNLKTVTLPAAAGNQALVYVGFKFVSQYGDNCAMDAVSIAATPCPVVNLGNDITQCATPGFSQTLDAGNAGATYLWDNASTAQTRTVTTAGTYYVAVTQYGCTQTDTVVVTLNPLPVVNIGNDTAICSGSSLVLDAGNTGASYMWDDASTSQTRTVNAAGTYYVQVTGTNTCSQTDTIDITLNASPLLDLGNDTAICSGTSITFDATNTGATYEWNNATTNATLTTDTAGTFSVTVTTANMCSASDTITLTINPTPTVDLGNDTAICSGVTLTLDAANAGESYEWDNAATTQTRDVNAAGTYYVMVTTSSNCSASDTINVTQIAAPTATISSNATGSGGYTFDLNSPSNVTNTFWDFGDNGTGNGTPVNHTYNENGTYTVTAYLVGMCNDTVITTRSVTVSDAVGIKTVSLGADQLTLYPNPANSVLNITNKSEYELRTVTIYNIIGQQVYSRNADSKNKHSIQLSDMASGVYTLKIETDHGFVMRKFEVVK